MQPKESKNSKGCRRHMLYITFKELRYEDWIFAPPGYSAYYCAGSCNFPFQHHVQATNHAVIQELAHIFQGHPIPKPCCAPSKLQGISLIYKQNEWSYSVKRFRGMVATECACQ